VVAVVVSVLFFSSFGSNGAGPLDSIRTYFNYLSKAGTNTEHLHPWYYYLKMLAYSRYGRGPVWTEAAILALAVVGLGSALKLILNGRPGAASPLSINSRADPAFVVFMGVYTVFMTVVYSVIPYKTPWCMLSFLQGMIVLAGVGAAALIGMVRPLWGRIAVGLLLALGACHLGGQAYRGAVRFGADPGNPYVYSQTSTDYLKLVDRIEDIAKVSPDGYDTLIEVIAHPHSTWPLPWDLRRFRRVGYWTSVADVPDVPDVPIIVASPETADALAERVGDGYLAEFYGLRPDVLLNLYIRRDLWEAFLATRRPEGSGLNIQHSD
jgi:predicted membrane-bound mannosyltransferase